MTPAQIVFQAMCRDLLARGIKPTVKVIYELQDKFRFKFVYYTGDRKSPSFWGWEEPKKYELNSAYQQIRIDCLKEAGWELGKNYRWQPPAPPAPRVHNALVQADAAQRMAAQALHLDIVPVEG